MEAPDAFNPVNILKTSRGFPPPIRLGYTKAELYGDLTHLNTVDTHAIEVARCDHACFKDLLWHLVYSRNFFSELDKARAIFKWMTTKNLSTIQFDKYPEGSAEELFKALQNKETTYAKVFAVICGYAGLYCVVLTGYAKGRNFHPGDTFTGESNHSWNAVHIDDNWHFVDTKWAAMSNINNNTSVSVEDDFYFLTDPEQFIYSHWPHQTEWQFLLRKISLSEFQDMPFVKPHYFRCSVQLGWTEKPIIRSHHGVVSWTLKNPKPLKFGYKMTLLEDRSTNSNSPRNKITDFKSYIYQESKYDETRFVFRAPKAGLYCCKFYAKGLEPEDQAKHLTEIVEYKIDVQEPAPDSAPLPPCTHTIWGPGIKTQKLGLDAPLKSGVVASLEPEVDLKFQKTKPLNVLCKLRRRDVADHVLDACLSVTNSDKVVIHLNLPEPGEYGVEIYSSHSKSGRKYTQACQYLVLYLADDETSEFVNEICRGQTQDDSVDSFVQPDKETMSWNIPTIEAVEITERKGPPLVPDAFQLMPVNLMESPKPAPVSMAGVVSFYDFTDRRVIESLDAHAEEVALNNHANFRDLMWDLIFSVNVTNDLAKARLIFRWLTSKKMEEINFQQVEKDSPEEVLVWLKIGRSSHAHVFYTMCVFAGLHSVVVSGLVKGANYQIGQPMSPEEYQHWWNAVYIYGKWCLVDSYLATIPLISKTGSGELKYSFNENYFLVDPNKLIFSHYPDDPTWQLAKNTVTLDEFIMQPKITPHFLQFGLQPLSHKAGVVFAQDETEIQLGFPAKRTGLKFVFSLIYENGIDEFNGIKLNHFGMVECLPNSAVIRVNLPKVGTYSLHIFAKEDTPTGKDISFSQVCEYQLHQEKVPQAVVCPCPPCSSLMWGPGPGFYQLGLTPGNNRAIVQTKGGKAEVRIKMVRAIQLRTQVKLSPVSASDDLPLVVYKIIDNVASFTVMATTRGRYGLEIYARDPDTQDSEDMRFRQVAQYLIECNEVVTDNMLPKLPPGFLGPQPKFTEFGLKTLNEHDPLIDLKDGNHLEIQLGTTRDMKFNAQLIDAVTNQEFADLIFIQTQPSIVTFLVNIPLTGFFKLQIHGNISEDQSHTSLGLFNYLVHCRQVNDHVYPYPRQLGHWKEGCYMFEPLVLHAGMKEPEVKFRVHVPKAKQVVIFVEQQVQQLESRGPVQWEGKINLGRYYGTDTKVILAANYGGDEERFATLLEYRV